MSMRLLQGYVRHTYACDLESLYYVLLAICLSFSSLGYPGSPTRGLLDERRPDNPATHWFTVDSFKQLEMIKSGQLHEIESKIVPYITPVFKPLAPCLLELFSFLFPHRKEWGHISAADFWISPVESQQFTQVFETYLLDDGILESSRKRHEAWKQEEENFLKEQAHHTSSRHTSSQGKKRSRAASGVGSEAELVDSRPTNRSRSSRSNTTTMITRSQSSMQASQSRQPDASTSRVGSTSRRSNKGKAQS